MKKKIILRGLFTTLLAANLVACGNTDGDPVDSTDSGDEKSTVTFVSWLTEQADLDQQVVDAYKEVNPDVEVEFKYVGDNQTDNYYQQVDLMLLGDEDVDIVMTAAFAEHSQRADSGVYMPLDELFEDEGVDPYEEYEDGFVAPVDGNIYGIPGDAKSWLIYINKDKLDEAGLEVPPLDWTWEDFEEYAIALTDDDTTGSYFHNWDHFNYLNQWSLKLGNPIINDDGSLAFDDPKFKEFLEYRVALEDEGVMVPYETILATQSTYRDRFFNEEIAMFPIGSFLIAELDNVESFPHDFTTAFAMLPRDVDAPAGRTYTDLLYYSVPAGSENAQEAYDFLRFYTTEGGRIKGANLPTARGENKMDYVEQMITEEEYYDLESLEKVFTNPDWRDNPNTEAPPYQKPLADMMVEEASKYYLGEEDIDTVIDNMMRRGEQIVE